MWLSWLGFSPWREWSPVQFLVRTQAWVAGSVPGRGQLKKQPIDVSLSHRCFSSSLSSSLPFSPKINKVSKNLLKRRGGMRCKERKVSSEQGRWKKEWIPKKRQLENHSVDDLVDDSVIPACGWAQGPPERDWAWPLTVPRTLCASQASASAHQACWPAAPPAPPTLPC